MKYTPTAADEKWLSDTMASTAATAGPKDSLNESEFVDLAHKFFLHFNMCNGGPTAKKA